MLVMHKNKFDLKNIERKMAINFLAINKGSLLNVSLYIFLNIYGY